MLKILFTLLIISGLDINKINIKDRGILTVVLGRRACARFVANRFIYYL